MDGTALAFAAFAAMLPRHCRAADSASAHCQLAPAAPITRAALRTQERTAARATTPMAQLRRLRIDSARRQRVAQRARRDGALRRHRRARRRELRRQARRHLRADRPQRRRQDHAVQLPEPAVPVPGRRHPVRRQVDHQRADAPIAGLGMGRTFQNLAMFRTHAGARERHGRRALPLVVGLPVERAAAAARVGRGAAPARARRQDHGRPGADAVARTARSATCPSARRSAWSSRARWPPSRSCCCWTSRPPA